MKTAGMMRDAHPSPNNMAQEGLRRHFGKMKLL
jgi:hypothetical protein